MGTIPKIAVLGCGYWGKNLVRNFYQLGALGVVCDPGEGGRATAREVAPDVEVTADIDTVFHRDDVGAVAIATPAETHCRLAMRAMDAGKDVFVEKPLALDYRQGIEMKQCAEATGRVLMVGHLLEYHPGILKLRQMLGAGILGEINYIYSHRLNFGKIRTEENALWSFAPHDIAVILRLVGELPVEVTCVGGSYITPNLADVTLSCLHFRSGLRAHIFVSWLNPFKEQKLVVVGARKMAVFNDVLKENKLMLFNQRVEVRDSVPHLHNGDAEPIEISAAEPLRNECQHFLECVRDRRQPLTDGKSGTEVLQVLEACQLSLELRGNPIRLADLASPLIPVSPAIGSSLNTI
jgi:UDP-2-acetamido-3-amino-2,3-dideoxy-glucuronate N-acetyltransferase